MKGIKVSVKLAAGISLILLLAIILAINNFYSLDQITMRATNENNLLKISSDVDSLFFAGSQYSATFDQKYFNEAQVISDKIKQAVSNAKITLTVESSHQALGNL